MRPTTYGIADTKESLTGSWSCANCNAGGRGRDALLAGAAHARTYGHVTRAASTASVEYTPANAGLIPLPRPALEETRTVDPSDVQKLLAAVIARPGLRFWEYKTVAGIKTVGRVADARDALVAQGRITITKVPTGGNPKRVLVPVETSEPARLRVVA